jgi:hypothetical protein
MSALLSAALNRIRPAILLLQFAGNATVGLLVIAWLRIPDSHTWQLAFSAALAALIAAGFLLLHATILRRLRQPVHVIALWLRALILFLWLLLAYALSTAALHISDEASRRAGYVNSQLGHPLRSYFTFEHLYTWQQDAVTVILWFAIPALLLPFIVETVSRGPGRLTWRTCFGVLRRWQHWLTFGLASWLALWLSTRLIAWHPSYTVRGELLSTALRLGLVYLVDMLLMTLVLAIVAELLARYDAERNARWDPVAQPSAQRIKPISSS